DNKAAEEDPGKDADLGPVQAAHVAESPDQENLQFIGLAGILEYAYQRGGKRPDHEAHDKQRGRITQTPREEQDDDENASATQAGRQGDRPGSGKINNIVASEEKERHGEACPRAEAQDFRSGKRIAEKGLHLESCHSQGSAR